MNNSMTHPAILRAMEDGGVRGQKTADPRRWPFDRETPKTPETQARQGLREDRAGGGKKWQGR